MVEYLSYTQNVGGSSPPLFISLYIDLLSSMEEQQPSKLKVKGSNPLGDILGFIFIKEAYIIMNLVPFFYTKDTFNKEPQKIKPKFLACLAELVDA